MNEKALVFGIKRFAVHDGPGIRTTLFLKGCPLKCVWCHNPEGIRKAPQTAYFEERCISCGAVPAETFERVMPYTGLFLYDIKAFDRTVHKKCTGADNALILGNLRFLAERGAAVEIRIPLVPGYNDGEIPGIAAFLAGLPVKYPVRILPYHRQLDLKYGSLGLPRDYPDRVPLPNEIKKAEDTLASFGLRVIK